MMKCIAIDDEPIALSIVSRYCEQRGGIELETYSSPRLGMQRIREWMPDIVFLDIEMDGVSGLAIASQLPPETCFIFTTAYLRYALEGFDLDAVDYLHKPFAFSRFQTAFSKALRRIGRGQIKSSPQCIVVKQDYSNISIPLDDIVYIEAVEGYSKIFRMSGECVTSRILLKNVLAMLPADSFLRIHRSFVVARSKIRSFNRQEITLNTGATLPVGRQYAPSLLPLLTN